ncbi:MAG: hypothetical protein Q9190_000675 [Brigantiaea leucoxantha]
MTDAHPAAEGRLQNLQDGARGAPKQQDARSVVPPRAQRVFLAKGYNKPDGAERWPEQLDNRSVVPPRTREESLAKGYSKRDGTESWPKRYHGRYRPADHYEPAARYRSHRERSRSPYSKPSTHYNERPRTRINPSGAHQAISPRQRELPHPQETPGSTMRPELLGLEQTSYIQKLHDARMRYRWEEMQLELEHERALAKIMR